jgi:hypothetical protein
MSTTFDDVTKALGRGVSRREALRLLAGAAAGGVLGMMGLRKASAAPSSCSVFCSQFHGAAHAQCLATCKACGGPSGVCGGPFTGGFICCANGGVCCVNCPGQGPCTAHCCPAGTTQCCGDQCCTSGQNCCSFAPGTPSVCCAFDQPCCQNPTTGAATCCAAGQVCCGPAGCCPSGETCGFGPSGPCCTATGVCP